MGKKDKHFDMRLSEAEQAALDEIAERKRLTKTQVILNYIRRTAKKMGIPYE